MSRSGGEPPRQNLRMLGGMHSYAAALVALLIVGPELQFPECPAGMSDVAAEVEEALHTADIPRLAKSVHPVHGLTISSAPKFSELCDAVFSREAIPHLLGDSTMYFWRIIPDGEELEFRTFEDIVAEFTGKDLREERTLSVHRANDRKSFLYLSGQCTDPYYVAYSKPGFGEHPDFTWGSVLVVFDRHSDGEWYLVALGVDHWDN